MKNRYRKGQIAKLSSDALFRTVTFRAGTFVKVIEQTGDDSFWLVEAESANGTKHYKVVPYNALTTGPVPGERPGNSSTVACGGDDGI